MIVPQKAVHLDKVGIENTDRSVCFDYTRKVTVIRKKLTEVQEMIVV